MTRKTLTFALLVLLTLTAHAQQFVRSMSGTDFWMAFLNNGNISGTYTQCYIMIASEDNCTAYIDNPLQGWDTTVFVAAGEINRVQVPDLQTSLVYGCSIINEAWHISTSAPAIVYAANYYNFSYDMTAIMPSSALKCDYMTQTYNSEMYGPEINIVAPYDSTRIQITLRDGVSISYGNWNFSQIYFPGDTIDTLLMSGQTCRLYSAYGSAPGYTSGFSGTRIQSSKPIAVFQGHPCGYIPVSNTRYMAYGAGDILFEQTIPTAYWGSRFMVIPIPGRDTAMVSGPGGIVVGDMVTVTSLEDNCMLNIGDSVVGPLASGESYSFVLSDHPATMPDDVDMDLFQSDALPIEASSPVSVLYYIAGCYFAGFPGDPASAVVPPVDQGISYSIVQIRNTLFTTSHFISIVMPTDDVPLMTMNSAHIDTFFTSASNGLSYARIPVAEGVYRLDADSGRFLAMVYGLGNTESYACVAGMAFKDTSFDVRASRHTLCMGDTVTIFTRHRDSVSLNWRIDDQPITVARDTLHISFDSAGCHRVTIVMVPWGDSSCPCSQMSDTVIEIITVHSTYLKETEDTICLGDTLQWHGQTLTNEGIFTDSLHSVNGCDSIISMNLFLHPVFYQKEYDTVCPGDTILWNGRTFSGVGIYEDTLVSVDGCDSVAAIQLSHYRMPQVAFSVVPQCMDYRFAVHSTVEGDTEGCLISWTASPQDSSLAGQPWDDIVVSPSQSTTYRLVFDGCRCPFDTSFTLSPLRWPVAEMKVQPEQLSIDNLDIKAYDRSLNADARRWWVDGLFAGEEPVLYYRANILEDSLLLTLVATNEACSDTLTRVIPIFHSVAWAPNVFTPDGTDNTLFAPVLNECVAEELYIYNRQGLLVAHIVGDNPSWNGTHENTPCTQGAYVWLLRYHSSQEPTRTHEQVGTVLLLR